MKLKYKILFLDHDDTSVKSTPDIHYPAHVEIMQTLRPGQPVTDIDTWFLKNFDPGIIGFLRDELHFSDEEMALEMEIWRKYTGSLTPEFFPGFPELLEQYQSAGGLVCVVSHSEAEHIESFYEKSIHLKPDAIYGWEHEAEKRKPSPWPVLDYLKKTGLNASEGLVVDDLKPGLEMARAAGADFCAAGWGHHVPQIEHYMRRHADYFALTVDDLQWILFPDP
ncbi:MAG: HAD family hydrolase [Spirochaetales bacterium]|nr:HAD family hydrolase [Spirochaetales bacterium]